ncbi:hypothetical protein CcaverHIS002_0303340 [Cutaneotrichosporon cavernicola]|nr:hypothetical protein CcaverHIS002_0303340 [Cutaneotrichosporon cavernicola]
MSRSTLRSSLLRQQRWPDQDSTPHAPSLFYRGLAKTLGFGMWFFVFYRARQDGPALIGLRHPWDGHGHGDDHH